MVGAGAVERDQGRLGEAVGVVELDPQLAEIQQQLLTGDSRADGQLGGAAQPQLAQEAPPQQRAERVFQGTCGQAEVELARPALLQSFPGPLENARHGEEEGGLHLRQVALRLPEILQEVDVQRLGDVVAGVRDQDAFDDMVQGQKGQVAGAPRASSPGQERRHGLAHPAQAVVAEHHALGPAGGARGVAQRRQVAEADRRSRLGIERLLAAQCQERLPGHDGPRGRAAAAAAGAGSLPKEMTGASERSSPRRSSTLLKPTKSRRAPLAARM